LLAIAYYLDLSQRREDSRLVRAVADDLLQSEPTPLAGENPFFENLVKISLGLAWQESQKAKETRASRGLLTRPDQLPFIWR
jgi:hypothetical protein